MDIEGKPKPAVSEVGMEETGPQNPTSPMEAVPKVPVGEVSLPMDVAGGRVVTLGMKI
jgi:hypothetical protein